jgi:oligoribonuclease
MQRTADNVLVWVDLEMTGLDPETCAIVEMAMILTDTEFNQLTEPLNLAIWQADSVLETMCPYVRDMHTKTGLIKQIRESKVSLEQAEQKAMKILTEYCAYGVGRLCGNSIWQDRRFLKRYMPTFTGYLHYRQIDVSSVKELGLWWYDSRFQKPNMAKHTALSDIKQSIEELQFYRDSFFKERG